MASQKTVEKIASQVVLDYLGREIELLDIAEMAATEGFSDKDLKSIHSRASDILAEVKADYQDGK